MTRELRAVTDESCTPDERGVVVRRASDLVGDTPLIELARTGTGTRLLLKLEQLNPTGSCKVRMARRMVDDAEHVGILRPGDSIVEPTSGNTGLGLALIALERGYQFVAVVDRHAAQNKLRAMAALGTKLVMVDSDPADGPSSVQRRAVATRIAAETGAFYPDQHNNPSNADAYSALAVELVDQLGTIDVLVAPLGTGGSLCGTIRALRALGHDTHSVAVEPRGSIVFGGPAAVYYQTGAGSPSGFPVGSNVDKHLVDDDYRVGDAEAFATARVVARRTGILVGGTTGAAISVALRTLLSWPSGSTVVALCNDAGDRYLDTVYNEDWLAEHGLIDDLIARRMHRLFRSYDDSLHVGAGDEHRDDDRQLPPQPRGRGAALTHATNQHGTPIT